MGFAELSLRQSLFIRRYVATGRGSRRRYLQLMGSYMLLQDRKLVRFGRLLARDARRTSDDDLRFLLGFEWRSRYTAAWLIGLDRRTQFREQLGRLLLESKAVYAGGAYCFALARFAEERDAEILVAYLDHYLPQLDCRYDQNDAIGALLHLDQRLGTEHASRFLQPGGLWEGSAVSDMDPAESKALMDVQCSFADACMTKSLRQWLPHRRRFMEEQDHPI
ncbi:DUF6000 family protein [Nonomuraea sp. NPDC050790]|uniref:DUF6000 family protein n=1 Tax=Nonomuraea sp. NPDC050790 TaxID=3364371 RepID=UPI0037922AF0